MQNFVGVFYDAILSYGCKCSEMLFEIERKGKKFNRYETRHYLDPKKKPLLGTFPTYSVQTGVLIL